MRITITGPRSVGKSTISKIVAKRLKLKYISSDEIGEKALKDYGGLDKAIKSGLIKKLLKKSGYGLITDQYKKDNFVFDLSGGSISSTEFPEASQKVREIAKSKSIIIGLLPFKDNKKSISFLYKREKERPHFIKMNLKETMKKTKKHFMKLLKILPIFCNHIIYTKERKPSDIAEEIVKKIKKS